MLNEISQSVLLNLFCYSLGASSTPSASMIVTKEATASLASSMRVVAASAFGGGEDEISQQPRELQRRAACNKRVTTNKHVQYTKTASSRRVSAPASIDPQPDKKPGQPTPNSSITTVADKVIIVVSIKLRLKCDSRQDSYLILILWLL